MDEAEHQLSVSRGEKSHINAKTDDVVAGMKDLEEEESKLLKEIE